MRQCAAMHFELATALAGISLPIEGQTSVCSACRKLLRAAAPSRCPAGPLQPLAVLSSIRLAERGTDHNGCNGCSRRSLGFAAIRSPQQKPLQTTSFGEQERTGANARQRLPCRRSWVRVPSSALQIPANGRALSSHLQTQYDPWQGLRAGTALPRRAASNVSGPLKRS
jgi:hypothetical protein